MPIEKSENELGGTTYSVPPGEKLSRLPAKIRALVDDFDQALFLDPNLHVTKLADRCRHSAMRNWLRSLAEGGFCGLQIHTADVGSDKSFKLRDVYFDFLVGDQESINSIQFSRRPSAGRVHISLEPVYDLVAGINPSIWGCAGGQLFRIENQDLLTRISGWDRLTGDVDAGRCRDLYASSDGDHIGWHEDGSAVWFRHETGHLEVVSSIDSFLDLYFLRLVSNESVSDAQELVTILRQAKPIGKGR